MKRVLLVLSLMIVACNPPEAPQAETGSRESQKAPASAPTAAAPRAEEGNRPPGSGSTPASFASLAQRLSPSVVNISATTVQQHPSIGRNNPFREFFGDDFFDHFFGGREPFPQGPQEFRSRSLGSGFILDAEGHIITNNHVVAKAEEISVRLAGGQEFVAETVGTDPQTDVALIRIDPGGAELRPVTLGDSDALRIGDWVLAIGNPFGYEHTVTAGILGAKGRVIGAGPYDDFLQTDAAINPGNSGGPLFDMNGRVIGINTAIVASGQGIGFAIPINLATQIVEQLQAEGKVTRGWLGVVIQEMTPELAERFGLEEPRGALVSDVNPGSPADEAGIRRGDVILELEGKPVEEMRELPLMVAQRSPGTEVELTILRDRERSTLTVTLGELEGQQMATAGEDPREEGLGLTVQPISPELQRHFDLENRTGVVITTVEPGSPAAEAGLRRGTVILEVNGREVEDLDSFREAVRSGERNSVLLLVKGQQGTRYIVVERKG